MAKSSAFVKVIAPHGTSTSEHDSVHQSSPTWVVTFVRWAIRDTLRTKGDPNTVRKQLVVENDCVAVSTADSKGTLTPNVSITLVETDVNYATAVAPGDFIFVNMLNWESHARRVAKAAKDGKPINSEKDGFKGVYKVQSVRKTVSAEPGGVKRVFYKVTGFAFTEFNNSIYFNPYLLDQRANENQLLYNSEVLKLWTTLVNDKGLYNIQDIIAKMTDTFIGSGVGDDGQRTKAGTVVSPNVHFSLPPLVGQLMGISKATAAKDLFNYVFGIQQYTPNVSSDLAIGMNPTTASFTQSGRFYLGPKVEGNCLAKPEYWNQVKTWAILNQFVNAPLNELYTAFRIAPNGRIMPTVVLRQTPFTSESYAGGSLVTHFLNLPRWHVDAALITDSDIGREEAARINYVQVFGKSSVNSSGADLSLEIAAGNYTFDIGDVQRSGLRPYVINTSFDEQGAANTTFRSPAWSKIIADAVIGSHLKLNGTITCIGIVDPIAVGDNLEFDGVVFHIETVSHQCAINPSNGVKQFRTTIGLSSGVLDTASDSIQYGEMTDSGGYQDRARDHADLGILPGISENQDTVYRPTNLDLPRSKGGAFAQPGGKGTDDE